MIVVCKRLNNTKRPNLLVNTTQGKHVPCTPSEALEMFDDMAEEVTHLKGAEGTLVVGFAETATAIGAHVASQLNLPYIQTTREQLNSPYISFKEVHSHAPSHNLYIGDLHKYNHILFVEDEVTTGNTILAAVEELRKRKADLAFTVLSYVNCMEQSSRELFEKESIDVHYCMHTSSAYTVGEAHYRTTPITLRTEGQASMDHYVNVVGVDPRYGVTPEGYGEFLDQLKDCVPQPEPLCKVLVLGTEECMYPAIWLGSQYEAAGCDVLTHSTTRSPIHVEQSFGYPLNSRCDLRSMYDAAVNTYVYNLQQYDKVIVVTDADVLGVSMRHLLKVLRSYCNEDITLVQITYGKE